MTAECPRLADTVQPTELLEEFWMSEGVPAVSEIGSIGDCSR